MISGFAKYSGGVENVVNELGTFLSAHNSNLTVFGRSNQDFVEYSYKRKTVGIFPYRILPSRLRFAHFNKYAYSLRVWKKINHKHLFDIIHGHGDNCFFPCLLRDETPFLMTFHGTLIKGVTRFRPSTIPIVLTEKIAALRCDAAIACSHAVKNEMVSLYGANPKKISVIHNGVNVDKFIPQNKELSRKRMGLPLNRIYALWVGNDPVWKGLSTCIKAIERIPNVHLLVVGLNGVSNGKTVFLGQLLGVDLINAYNAADFLVFPTRYEGFPLVPLEALACGLPIIVAKESNYGEIIEEGMHGFIVTERDPSLYEQKINLLLNGNCRLREMATECRKLATKYSWTKQAEKYLKIYEKMTQE